eukprot:TRINITY_DN6775_c0_g1_i1.p1 TRINITY_DN6775_c0_g1~~TRINITY_DN6775_c0_g1_i1.p1  ORF type:complete len:520 (+),score=76.93 TRINITY_DN6775_c0_g1_i1:124-1683(+)
MIAMISSFFSDVASSFRTLFEAKDGSGKLDSQAALLVGVCIFCSVLPLELGQISFALVGAAVYAAVQSTRQSTKAKFQVKKATVFVKNGKDAAATQRTLKPGSRSGFRDRIRPNAGISTTIDKPEYRQVSAQPVKAPRFLARDFDVQVQELLETIAPSPQSDRVMVALADAAKKSLRDLLPDADVMAFASGDMMRGTAFGVAVPEVDIILNAEPNVIADGLRVRTARPIPRAAQLDARKLQKSALRACTDELVAGGVFKFRRSAFKGMEPKVTLLALGFSNQAIPVDFSVNTVAPCYNAALLTECGQIDPRAKSLILLVRRWAKDRGVSHAAKGHLPPYAWTLLAIYFMQVRDGQDGPSLAKLKAYTLSSPERQEQQPCSQNGDPGHPPGSKPIATLFKEFFHFYACIFDWRNECICVRSGKRTQPSHRLPLHIVMLADGSSEVAPSVVDPFEPTRNLGSTMTAMSLTRLREEFVRADELCGKNSSLSELFEPWVPPERGISGRALNNAEGSAESAGEA